MKKRKIQKIICIILIAIFTFTMHVSYAVSQKDLDEVNNKLKDAENQLGEVKDDKSDAVKAVEQMTNKISSYEDEIDHLTSEIEELNQSIDQTQEKLDKATEEYNKQSDLLDERLITLYENGETSYLDVLLSSSNLTDFISNYFLVSELASYDTELLEKIEDQRNQIDTAKRELEQSKQKVESSKKQKEVKTQELKVVKQEKDKEIEKLSDEEKKLQKEIQQLQEDNRKILNAIREAEKKYEDPINNLPVDNTPAGSGYFTRPVKTGSITAQAYYSSGKFHGAIDYGVSNGTPVYAAATGVVMVTANLNTSYGTHVIIRHGNGLQTYYAHGTPGSICVKQGQTVQKGELIMKSGNTGNSGGPHLHFEVRKSPYNYNGLAKKYGDDSRVNPLNYL